MDRRIRVAVVQVHDDVRVIVALVVLIVAAAQDQLLSGDDPRGRHRFIASVRMREGQLRACNEVCPRRTEKE